MNRYQELKRRLSAIELLSYAKTSATYAELSRITGLPIPVLSRYVKGHVLPSIERSRELVEKLGKEFLIKSIQEKIRFEENKIFDHSEVLGNVILLERIAQLALRDFEGVPIDKILTVEVDGILPASHLARELNVELVVAKAKKEMGISSFVEVRRVFSSGVYSYLFVPKSSIRRGDSVLIVDDALRTGSTLRALVKVCEECHAKTTGAFVLIGLADTLRQLRRDYEFPVRALVEV